jgi:hypothetical protein
MKELTAIGILVLFAIVFILASGKVVIDSDAFIIAFLAACIVLFISGTNKN